MQQVWFCESPREAGSACGLESPPGETFDLLQALLCSRYGDKVRLMRMDADGLPWYHRVRKARGSWPRLLVGETVIVWGETVWEELKQALAAGAGR